MQMRDFRVHFAALCLALASAALLAKGEPPPPALGTWTTLTNDAPTAVGLMMQLTDGSVIAQGWDPGDNWYRLAPDASGSYVNGSWTQLASMSIPRLYFASHILRDGRLWLLGGEYTGNPFVAHFSNTGEVYDPLINMWSPIAHHPETRFGDDPSMLLDGDRILAGSISSQRTYLYDIATNTWSAPINKVYNDRSDEEGWAKLADGSVLTYDLFKSKSTAPPGPGSYAERFDPTLDLWLSISPSDGMANGFIPQLSANSVGSELGPPLRLQDGRIFVVGATGHTALYNPSINTWSAGPDVIGTLNGSPALFGADDAPGAVLPNGHVIFAADAGPTLGTFHGPAQLFEFDPTTNTLSSLPSPTPHLDDPNFPAYILRFLVLPTGQVLMTDSVDGKVYVYNPPGNAPNRLSPRIEGIKYNGNGVFTLSGQQLNGQSAGSAYGDDSESDSNYPIVSLTDKNGRVFYTRTTNWSTTGVGTQTAKETVDFTLPASLTQDGVYKVTVSGAGISSVNSPALHVTAVMIAGS